MTMLTLYWFGVPVVEVLGYWSDGADLMARVTLVGDVRPRWTYASMLEVRA